MALKYADDKQIQGSELLELYKQAGWGLLEERSPERIEAAVRRSGRCYTARDGSKLVGYLLALTDLSLYAHVSELLVREGYQDKGVTQELLRRFLESVPEVEHVTLFGDPQSAALYRGLGFSPHPGGFMLRR